MEFFKIVSLKEAKEKVMQSEYRLDLSTERISISESLNRYASKAVQASLLLPPFSRSTVDGYAVAVQDVMGASESIPAMLTLGKEIRMGQTAGELLEIGEAVYVPTGGMVPENAEGVVMIEYTEKLDDETVLIQKPLAYGENIINKGDDLKPGDVLIEEGERISGRDMGMIAGAGISEVDAFVPIKVAIFSTGDEIIDCDVASKDGEIYDINGYALKGEVERLGCRVISKEIIKDNFDRLRAGVEKALGEADLIMLSGGSSVGTRDFTQAVIDSFEDGELLFHGISIKPGKPTMVGKIGKKLVFCLPGHPTASALVFQELVKPYILSAFHSTQSGLEVHAAITENLHAAPGKDNFIPVELISDEKGFRAKPLLGKSGLFSIMADASGYIHLSSEMEGVMAGEDVRVKIL
ncbi:MAG: molybdopterin molybdotransferase [Clostridiales bacterium]|nr:molybdopterin molybdotransferase [Clostridiales bacterium]